MDIRKFGTRFAPILTHAIVAFFVKFRQRRLALERVELALQSMPMAWPNVLAILRVVATPHLERSNVKGDVSQAKQQARYASDALAALEKLPESDDPKASAELLTAAFERAAACNIWDPQAFVGFVGSVRALNRGTLESLAAYCQSHVAVHVSCLPRISRAQASISSFSGKPATLSHIIVVGDTSLSPHQFLFDVESAVLKIPCPDSYELLPAKVTRAYAFLALIPHIRAVLKLDDDHRLVDANSVNSIGEAEKYAIPVQIGNISYAATEFSSNCCWHIGKCQDPILNSAPSRAPRPITWAGGESGYILNRAALRIFLFNFVYSRDYIDRFLYEDMLISDVVERFGGAVLQRPKLYGIGAVADY